MQRNLIAASLLAALALTTSATAASQGGEYRFSVRNDSSETLNCRVQRQGQSRHQSVVLRAGQEWTLAANSAATRTIFCDPPAEAVRYRIEPGTAYRMDEIPIPLRSFLPSKYRSDDEVLVEIETRIRHARCDSGGPGPISGGRGPISGGRRSS